MAASITTTPPSPLSGGARWTLTGGQIYRLPKGMGALHLLRAQPSANQKSAVFFRFFLPLLPPPVRFTNLNGSFPHLFTFTQGFFCNGTHRYGVPAPFPSYEK